MDIQLVFDDQNWQYLASCLSLQTLPACYIHSITSCDIVRVLYVLLELALTTPWGFRGTFHRSAGPSDCCLLVAIHPKTIQSVLKVSKGDQRNRTIVKLMVSHWKPWDPASSNRLCSLFHWVHTSVERRCPPTPRLFTWRLLIRDARCQIHMHTQILQTERPAHWDNSSAVLRPYLAPATCSFPHCQPLRGLTHTGPEKRSSRTAKYGNQHNERDSSWNSGWVASSPCFCTFNKQLWPTCVSMQQNNFVFEGSQRFAEQWGVLNVLVQFYKSPYEG